MLKESESNINPVFQLMKDRKLEESKVWGRADGQKLGVVIEGGSHRAVVSAAFLSELLVMGYRDSIDVLYGESVGACNGAVFASGQLPEAIKTYWQLVNNWTFVNPLRVVTGRPMVDIDFFMAQAEKHYPFNFDAFIDSGIRLEVMAARVNKPQSPEEAYPLVRFSEFKDKHDLLEVLRAAIQMPFFCGRPYLLNNGMELWDGGIIDKLPAQTAIEDGCSHILVASATPLDYIPRNLNPLEKYLSLRYLRQFNPEIADYYGKVRERFRQTMQFLRQKQITHDGPPYVAVLTLPKGTKRLSTFEIREKALLGMAQRAREVVRQTLK